jgi:hypothetical protein
VSTIQVPSIEEKLARLDSISRSIASFARQGGNLDSTDSFPLGLELIYAADDIAREFGYRILRKPQGRPEPGYSVPLRGRSDSPAEAAKG